MSTSGGLVYHFRALRYQEQEWVHHRNCVFNFLEAWQESMKLPREKSLVMVGSSGGYSLPEAFLKIFQTITIYEPDFLARVIFERRFKTLVDRIMWMRHPYDFKSELPEGVVLFCNVLGQIEIRDFKKFKANLDRVLKNRVYASFHDALSGEQVRFLVSEMAQPKSGLDQMRSWIETRAVRPVNLIAHLAPDLFDQSPSRRFFYWQWRLTRKRAHLIEGVFSQGLDE